MQNTLNSRLLAVLGASVFAAAVSSSQVSGQSLDFNGTPASNVVAQLNHKYGIFLILKPGIRPEVPVTFSSAAGTGPESALQAVNQFANALHADYQKVFVVAPANQELDLPTVHVDTDARMTFPALTVSADQAIKDIANADSAEAQVSDSVTGDVTFTSRSLTVRDAANEVESQTHTMWKAYYAILPNGGHRNSSFGSIVVGHTNSGQPITQLPFSIYQHVETSAEREQRTLDAQKAQVAQPDNGTSQDTNTNANDVPYQYDPSNNGYAYGNGNNAYNYGYNPYSNYGGGMTFGNGAVTVLPYNGYGGGGYGYGNGYGNGYGYQSPYVIP